jgi:hypothetical protein|tara:strand:+ start:6634 stop:7830 length:1197 start_codon:yes stop_codon:yes gene_type:complete
MNKTVFIGGIDESTVFMLARLFNGHPDAAVYPFEFGFPNNHDIYPIDEIFIGIPNYVPSLISEDEKEIYNIMRISAEKKFFISERKQGKNNLDGTEQSFLGKEFQRKVEDKFYFDRFLKLFDEYRKGVKTIAQLYEAWHKAFFQVWGNGKYSHEENCLLMFDSNGFYLSNLDKFFSEFNNSFFIFPFRNVINFIGAEKKMLARRYYGASQFGDPKLPNVFVKNFKNYDLEAQIRLWITAVTRTVLFQEKYGVQDRFIVCNYEELLKNREGVMRVLCEKIGLKFHSNLLTSNVDSHGSDNDCIDIFTPDEVAVIENETAGIQEYLLKCQETPLDLTGLDKETLSDYIYQEKYINDEEKLALYSTLLNCTRYKNKIKVLGTSAITAFIYSKIIRFLRFLR